MTQQSRDYPLEELMDSPDSKPLEGSLTNELVITEDNTVVKRFCKRPKMAYLQMIGRLPAGDIKLQDQISRIENEKIFRNQISGMDVNVPDIIRIEEHLVEFELVEGEDLNTYLNQASAHQAFEAGERVGEFLRQLHNSDAAITDLRINNFMVKDDSSLAFVDAEYFSPNSTEWEKKMDVITLISSAKQVKPKSYSAFAEGFQETYKESIGLMSDTISSVTAPLHAVFLEYDRERLMNSAINTSNSAEKTIANFFN